MCPNTRENGGRIHVSNGHQNHAWNASSNNAHTLELGQGRSFMIKSQVHSLPDKYTHNVLEVTEDD